MFSRGVRFLKGSRFSYLGRDFSTSSRIMDNPRTHRIITGVLGAGVIYCGYNLAQLALDFPEPCRNMMSEARNNVELMDVFGGKISMSPFWDGTIRDDFVSVKIPIAGPRATGTLYGSAVKVDDLWSLMNCEVHVNSKEKGAENLRKQSNTSDDTLLHPYDSGISAVYDLVKKKGILERHEIETVESLKAEKKAHATKLREEISNAKSDQADDTDQGDLSTRTENPPIVTLLAGVGNETSVNNDKAVMEEVHVNKQADITPPNLNAAEPIDSHPSTDVQV